VLEKVKVVDKLEKNQFFRFTHDAINQAKSIGLATTEETV